VATSSPERFSRKWFGEIFFACWGGLVFLQAAVELVGLHRGGLFYWLIGGPLLLGFAVAGVPWVGLALRDGYRARHQVWTEARVWLAPVAASLALVFAIALIADAVAQR
jgi:hypothetical protein